MKHGSFYLTFHQDKNTTWSSHTNSYTHNTLLIHGNPINQLAQFGNKFNTVVTTSSLFLKQQQSKLKICSKTCS